MALTCQPSFFHEPAGFLPFKFSKIRAGGESGLPAEEAMQGARGHSQIVAEGEYGCVDRKVVHYQRMGQLPPQVAGGCCRARSAQDFDFQKLAKRI